MIQTVSGHDQATTLCAPDQTAAHALQLCAGTVVMTLEGALPVEHLLPGDRVITRAGAQKIVAVSSRAVQGAAVLRVSTSSLGHDRPAEDMTLTADQHILIRDWRAKAMFGAAQAVVPAARLVDGSHIRRDVAASLRIIALEFDRAAVVQCAGLDLATQPQTVHA